MENGKTINNCSLNMNIYHMEMEKNGDVIATTLYKNGRVVLYEETTKEIRHVENYGDFEVEKVLKRIHFDENGKIVS